jgi:hypothetical protein
MLNAAPLRSDVVDVKQDRSTISADDVTMAFRLILGRQPESDAVITAHQLPTLNDLRLVLLRSKEFAEKYKMIQEMKSGGSTGSE